MRRLLLMTTVLLASLLVSFSQMLFYAIQGTTADPNDDDTLQLRAVRSGPNAQLRINVMFINIPGRTQQPIRSVLFQFTPAAPITVPNGQLLAADADPAQASNQLQMQVRMDGPVRVGQAVFPGRFRIRDTNGNVQEQQGSITITVRDTEPYAFQRPNPNAPRDRITIQFVINNVPVNYTGEISTPRGTANLFVGGRAI